MLNSHRARYTLIFAGAKLVPLLKAPAHQPIAKTKGRIAVEPEYWLRDLGSVTSPITRSFPPHFGHTLRSIPNTLLSRAIQVMGAVDATLVFSLCSVLMGEVCRGTMR